MRWFFALGAGIALGVAAAVIVSAREELRRGPPGTDATRGAGSAR